MGDRTEYTPYSETPTDWTDMKFTPQKKKDVVRFVVAGVIALLLSKSEKIINSKADDYFGPDEPKKKKTDK